jgi:hypothetical protein
MTNFKTRLIGRGPLRAMSCKFHFPLFVLILFTQVMISQETSSFSVDNYNRVVSSIGVTFNPASPGFSAYNEDILGTPYIFDDVMPGKIKLRDGNELSAEVAFNIHAVGNGGFVVFLPNGNAVDVRESLVSELQISNEGKFQIFKPVESSEIIENSTGIWVVEILYEDDEIVFMKRQTKYIRTADDRGPYSAQRKYHEYLNEIEYYLGMNSAYSKIRLNKNSIESVVPELKGKLKGAVTETSLVETLKSF